MLTDVTFPELVAYYHKTLDRDSFADLLRQIHARSTMSCRQRFETVVEELEKVGLKSAANDVQTFAETLPHKWELRYEPSSFSDAEHYKRRMAEEKAQWEAKQNSREPAS
jgi:hypothetical protein